MENTENQGNTKSKRTRLIVCASLATLIGVLLYMQILYELGGFYFGPKIKGSVTLRTESGDTVYEFEDPKGGYGWYEWTVGTGELPIDVYLFNKNGWQTTRMDFIVQPDGQEWLVTGKISSNRFQRQTYEARIPAGERISIIVDF